MSRLKAALLAATLLAGGAGLALAQAPSTYDPAQLPEVKGEVAQYTLTPRGDVDGLILSDGTEVHVSPSMSTELVFAVRPGDAVTIHGLKARALPMVAAASVTNDASGATVQSEGRRFWRDPEAQLQAQGTIKAALHTPRGDVNGVLLTDGTQIRLPPPEATRLADMLATGKTIVVKGNGVASPLGKVILARQIGPDANNLTEVSGPRMHAGDMMSMMHGRGGRGEATPPAPAPTH